MKKNNAPLSVVFLDRASFPERIKIPPPNAPHTWVSYDTCTEGNVIQRAHEANVLVVNKVCIDDRMLDACPQLQHIAVTATGFNVIDINACEARGISVSNVPSYAATTVSEHVIGAAIVLRREMLRYANSVANGEWQKSNVFCLFGKPFHTVNDSTIGLIGMGEIAQATAKKAHALGMNVIFCARTKQTQPFATQVTLSDLLKRSDIVSVHCNLNPSTNGLLGKDEISLMSRHSILINTARGGIVDEAAAVAAIKNQSIAGLAFDVLSTEPPEERSPLLSIAHHPNVLITPHIAWASDQAMQYLANTVSQNIDAFIEGRALNLVTQH